MAEASDYQQILANGFEADDPGAAALVVHDGEVVFRGAVGMANLELRVPLEPDMVFEIGSITKQFTAAAILLLAEEGKLSIEDPITRHLPDYPAYGDDITIEHLLTHTSGIVSYTGIPGYMPLEVRHDRTPAEMLDVFKDLPVEFAPGERYAYNNSGYVLLGAIIEAVSGMTYPAFVQTRFFDPLGMETARYGCDTCIIPRRASGYDAGITGAINQQYLSFTQPYAAGSLMMTVDDLHRWSEALFSGEVISEESLERMTTPFVLNAGAPTRYGYGLMIGDVRDRLAFSHGGGIFGFSAYATYLPEEDVFVAVFANSSSPAVATSIVAERLGAQAIGDPIRVAPRITLPVEVLEPYVGVYILTPAMDLVITLEDGQLRIEPTGQANLRIVPTSQTEFEVEGVEAQVVFDIPVDGMSPALTLHQGGQALRATRRD